MKKIHNSIGNKMYSDQKLHLIILIVSMLFLMNYSIKLNGFGDDSRLFLNPLLEKFNGNYLAFFVARYNEWSSRIVIEFFTIISVQHHLFWKIFNTIMMAIGCILPPYILKVKKNVACSDILLSTGIFLLIPLSLYKDTGWIATTTNYLWVCSTGTIVFLALAKIFRTEKISPPLYILSLFSMIYATNHEQMCVLIFVLLTLFLIYYYKIKCFRKMKLLLPFLFINLGNFAFIKFSLGNSVRYKQEVIERFPDYDHLSIFRKIELGYSATLNRLFFNHQLIIFVFFLLILVACVHKCLSQNKLDILSIFGLIPFLLSFILSGNLFGAFDSKTLAHFKGMFTRYGTSFRSTAPSTWIAEFVITVILLSICLSFIYLFGKSHVTVFLLLLLGASISVRMILGFSPTVWASSGRTYFFTYGLIILLVVFLVDKLTWSESFKNTIVYFVFALGCSSLLVNTITIFMMR